MAFVQSLSGLNSAATGLDIIGNNISNVGTVGFKSSRPEFADIFAATLKQDTGSGTSLQKIQQQFTQGGIQASNNNLDFAINGGGMFRLVSKADGTGQTAYSRNGEFHYAVVPGSATEAYIVNANGSYLTGWNKGMATTETPVALKTTNSLAAKATTTVSERVNLDDRASIVDTGIAFDPSNLSSYSWSTAQAVYSGVDGDTNSHKLTTYYAKRSDSTWDVYTRLDDQAPSGATTLNFSSGGVLTSAPSINIAGDVSTSVGKVDATGAPVLGSDGQQIVTTSTKSMNIALDLTGTTAYAAASDISKSEQNGYLDGRLQGVKLELDGTITGTYSNGQTGSLGQVALANFVNPNGLRSVGNNLWMETSNSGAPTLGKANSNGMGVVGSNQVEQANVDLAQELIDMITMQRNYQANAQMIKAQDQVLQTLAALR